MVASLNVTTEFSRRPQPMCAPHILTTMITHKFYVTLSTNLLRNSYRAGRPETLCFQGTEVPGTQPLEAYPCRHSILRHIFSTRPGMKLRAVKTEQVPATELERATSKWSFCPQWEKVLWSHAAVEVRIGEARLPLVSDTRKRKQSWRKHQRQRWNGC
jgi:hypothetical protein